MMKLNNYILKEVADSLTGPFGSQLHESDYVEIGTPIVTVEHLGVESFTTQNLPFVSIKDKERLSKYILRKGDIVFSRVGSVDRCTYVSKNEDGWMFSGRCIRIRPNEKINPRYLSFYFRQKYFKKMMKNISVGATMPSLNTKLMDEISLKLPLLPIQNTIAKVLSDLDAKIELNNKINAKLEAMAKLIYDYLFVQFDFPLSEEQAKEMGHPELAGKPYKSSRGKMVYNEELKREIPEGWEVELLSDCCRIIDCLHSKKPNYSFESESSYLLQLENIKDDGLIDIAKKYHVSVDEYKVWTKRIEVKDNDIVITNAGRVAATAQIPENIITGIGRNITTIRPKKVSPTYLFQAFKGEDMRRQILWNTDTGSFFKSLNVKGIKLLNISRPNNGLEEKFEKMVLPMRRKRERNQSENQKLTGLRDWLLPMLMNGQVSVDGSESVEAEKQAEGFSR